MSAQPLPRWDDAATAGMTEPQLLLYRSNLLGSDLRITNYGGGNTSAKIRMPDPLTGEEVRGLRGLRPAGPPPRPSVEPVRVQRRVSAVGTVMVCRQVVSLGRPYAGQTVTVHVSDTTITVDLDGQIRVIRRTTDVPVRNVKANKPHKISDVV